MKNQLPKRLVSATTVGIYSPSGSFSDNQEKTELFERGVARLRTIGFSVRESRNCRSSWYHASAQPIDRVADLHQLLADPDVDIILPSIGGHVATQLLPLLDFDAIAASEKALFGFSDNAIIPVITTAKTGICTFHTLCDITFGFGRFTELNYPLTQASLLNAVRNQEFDLAGSRSWQSVQRGESSGTILGGNLKGLAFLAGTQWWPDWHGKIMFWESADPLHAVMQHLVHLANARAFDELAGMVIGRISTLKESFYQPDQVVPIQTMLLDVLELRDRFPIIMEADIGHDVENVTIPLGVEALLRVDDQINWVVRGLSEAEKRAA